MAASNRSRRRRQRVVSVCTRYNPPSKWTVVAAFIVAVALHVGAVMWVETPQEKPTVEAGVPAPIHPMEKAILEKGAETGAAVGGEGTIAAD